MHRLRRALRLFPVLGLAATITAGLTRADTPKELPPPMKLMSWPDLLDRPLPTATKRIPYGALPQQVGDLWLPEGAGPFPVVLMIHGGCWRKAIADLTIMNYIAEDLRKRGIAVWNIEYRGMDEAGGGYPGTFQDVAMAADALGELAKTYPLKTDGVVAVGHSAGGHLVFWLAARGGIGGDSPLKGEGLKLAAAISLGGLPDLKAARALGTCGQDTIDGLVGAGLVGTGPAAPAGDPRSDVYADTSPAALPANDVPETMIAGSNDRISPPRLGQDYVATMRAKGQPLDQSVIAESGHVELIAPDTAAWAAAVAAILRLQGR